uniref:Uncharacterized protein n=1 Tax=Arundo donax TaxID=35708 RepID=A0A0A9D644_ARUDO
MIGTSHEGMCVMDRNKVQNPNRNFWRSGDSLFWPSDSVMCPFLGPQFQKSVVRLM